MYPVLQADVNLTELLSNELLTSFQWTPNGTLLLGTSGGRVLAVQGAAPIGLPGQNWGPVGAPGVLSAVELLSPTGLKEACSTTEAVGSVVHIAVTQAHIMILFSGGRFNSSLLSDRSLAINCKLCNSVHPLHTDAGTAAQIVWLDARQPNPARAIICKAGDIRSVTSASLSPNKLRFVLSSRSGQLSLCDALFSFAEEDLDGDEGSMSLTQDSAGVKKTPPQAIISTNILHQFHTSGIVSICALPGQVGSKKP